MNDLASSLRAVLADEKALWEVGRRAVEDALIDLRDSGIFIIGPGNGLNVNYADGTPSTGFRMSTFEGIKVALTAMAEHYEKQTPSSARTDRSE